MATRNQADRELKKLRQVFVDTFDKRRVNDTGVVTEVVRDRITDAGGQVLAGGKVRKVKFTASGLTDQVVNVPDGTAISVGDAIQVTRSANRALRPDWEYRRVIRSTTALGEVQDQDRHVSTPVGFQVDSSAVYTPVPGGTSFAYVELTWTENPAVEGVSHYIIAYRKDTETAWRTIADPTPPLRIEDLEVSQTYNFRIQAVNGHGVASTWSSIISYTTGADTTQPKPIGGSEGDAVANLAADFSDENIVITWDEIDLNDNDFSHYEIELYSDSGMGTQYRAITRKANSYTYTYGDNYNDTSGSPDPTVYIRVRAVDYTGNTNNWAAITATNGAPSAPTSLAGSWDKQDLVLTWTPPGDPDLSYFLISIYDDNSKVLKYRDFILSIGKANVTTATYTYRVEDNVADTGNNAPDTSLYVEVVAVDQFQQSSTADTLSSSKTTPSGTVGTVSTSFDDRDLFISFVGVTDTNLDRYKLVLTGAGGSFTYYTRANVFQYSYDQNVSDNGTVGDPSIGYSITWLNKHGQESSAVTGTATNAAPNTPANLSATGGFQQIIVTWDRVSDVDVIFYKLYGSESTGFTPGAGNLLFTGRGTEFSHAVGYNETWYYRVSAVDVFEQESTIAAEQSATSYAIDDNTPAAPATLTLTSDIEEIYSGVYRGVIYASWAATVGEPAALQYELRYKLSTESNYEYKKTGQKVTADSLHGLDPGKTYDVNVRAISRFGEESAWYNSGTDEQITITNDANAPLTGFAGHHLEKADADANFGNAAATQWRAQGFQAPVNTTVRKVTLRLKKVGAPSDNLTVEIQTDSVGVPSGSVITNGTSTTVAGSGLSTGYGWHEFSFATPPSVTASTQYHIVIKRSGANDASNYYVWYVDESAPDYDEGTFATYNGSTWSAVAGTDAIFSVSDFDVIAGSLKVSVLWTSPQDADLHRVNIYRHTSDASGSATVVANPAAYPNQKQQYVENYDDGTATFNAGTTYYYWLKFTDRAGNISGFTHTESTAPEGIDGGDLDTTAPTLPGDQTVTLNDGLTVADDGAYVGHIDVSWNASTDDASVTYEIRWKVQGASYQYTTSSTTSYRILGLIPGATYDINVRALDAFGNATAWYNSGTDTSQAISADASGPSAATGLSAKAGVMKVTLTWTTPSDNDAWRILVYRNTSDVSGTAIPVSILAAKKGETQQYVDQFDTVSNPFTPGTTYYYWINVSDRAGNLSGFTASVNAAPLNVGSGEGAITLQGWTQDIDFSSTDADTVGWGTGTITLSSGTTYSIVAGNTGNMVARTYIYLDTDVSSTILQTTTTPGTAVGDNKILIGTAVNDSDEALFEIFGGKGGTMISANEIAANTITANEIAAGTITGAEISATATITAGTGNNIGVLDGADATYRIYAGHATPASAPFRVTQAGAVTATSGTIGGWTLASTTLTGGIVTLDSAGTITVGNVTLDSSGLAVDTVSKTGIGLTPETDTWLTVGGEISSTSSYGIASIPSTDTASARVYGVWSRPETNSGSATIATYGFYAVNPVVTTGSITSAYGVFVEPITTAGTNWAFYSSGTADSYLGGGLRVVGTFKDTTGDAGTSGQLLSSTGTGTNWVNAPTSDHGGLTGLEDDDHTQYLLADGTRALTGDWDMGAFNIGIGDTAVAAADTWLTIDGEIASASTYGVVSIPSAGVAGGSVYGFWSRPEINHAGSTTSSFGYYAVNPVETSGSITTAVGFYCESITVGGTNWAFYSAGTTDSYLGGGLRVVGTFKDTTGDAGTSGQLLSSTGTGTNWIAQSAVDAGTLDGQDGTYYLDSANFTGTNWTDLTDGGNTTLHSHAGIGGDADTLDSIDSTGFLILAGQAGGQTAYGGTGAGDDLTIQATSHATDGTVFINNSVISIRDTGAPAGEFLQLYQNVDGSGAVMHNDNGTLTGITLDDNAQTIVFSVTGLTAGTINASQDWILSNGAVQLGTTTATGGGYLRWTGTQLEVHDGTAYRQIWHAANDGATSTLDADLLDGNEASAFATASHTHATSDVTSGTFADARIAASNVTQHEGSITHNNLSGLTTGDPHTQYVLLAGRSGGQSMYGGTAAGNDLTIQATSHATDGTVFINDSVISIRDTGAPAGEFLQLYQNADGSGAVMHNDNGTLTGITLDDNAQTIVFSVTGLTAGTINASQDWILSNGAVQLGTTTATGGGYLRWTGTQLEVHDGTAYRQIWHVANDGATSTLDADLLDGNEASAFATASHTHATADVTSGTFADARIASSNVTQHEGSITHNNLSGLTTGDPHTQYALLAGRSGGQSMYGGTAASNSLTLESTSNVTKGYVLLQPNGGNVGIGQSTPTEILHVVGNALFERSGTVDLTGYNLSGSDADAARDVRWVFKGKQSGGTVVTSAIIAAEHDGSGADYAGRLIFQTAQSGGSLVSNLTIHADGGLALAGATGGSQGSGTINVQDIYKNGTVYNDPDYVLEQWVTGDIERFADRPGASNYHMMSLDEVEVYIRKELHLPGIGREPSGAFERLDWLLEKVEELYIHLIELNKKVEGV